MDQESIENGSREVNSKHFVLALKVKSVLDPCEDENDDLPEDEEVNFGVDSMQEENSSSDSEVHPCENQYFVAPVGQRCVGEDNGRALGNDTQDDAYEDEHATSMKEWINERQVNNVDLMDILSNFPDISVALAKDIVERLLKDGLLTKAGKDSYTIYKKPNSKIWGVKEEIDMQYVAKAERTPKSVDVDFMYMKTLCHAFHMDYVTVAKLQAKLDGSRRLGKRAIHSESSNRKLIEAKKILEGKPGESKTVGEPFAFNEATFPANGLIAKDVSTCGGLHSIGSDLTRTRGGSETCQNGSVRNGQASKTIDELHRNSDVVVIFSRPGVSGGRYQDLSKKIVDHEIILLGDVSDRVSFSEESTRLLGELKEWNTLLCEVSGGRVWDDLQEGPISFFPDYKYYLNSIKYNNAVQMEGATLVISGAAVRRVRFLNKRDPWLYKFYEFPEYEKTYHSTPQRQNDLQEIGEDVDVVGLPPQRTPLGIAWRNLASSILFSTLRTRLVFKGWAMIRPQLRPPESPERTSATQPGWEGLLEN